METLDRIVVDPAVMAGKPCLKDTLVTVGTLVGLFATGHNEQCVLELYPYLSTEDVRQALAHAARNQP